MKKIAVFASGTGTNAENLARVFNRGNNIHVDLLIIDRKDAGARQRLEALGVETIYIPGRQWKENADEIVKLLQDRGIELIALAGFLRILGPAFTDGFAGRILNIHPSLLPAYGGDGFWGHNVHEAVLAAGEKKSGATVHVVTADVDCGPIVMQQEVPVLEDDTPETLEQRVHGAEYELYPKAVVKLLSELPDLPDSSDKSAETEQPEVSDTAESADPISNDRAWATALNLDFDEKRMPSTPPPVPGQKEKPVMNSVKPQATVQTATPSTRQAATQTDVPPMPGTYLVWSILAAVFCCAIPAIVAIIFSAQVSSRYYAGDYAGAEKASETTQMWIIASIVLGVVSSVFTIPFMFL